MPASPLYLWKTTRKSVPSKRMGSPVGVVQTLKSKATSRKAPVRVGSDEEDVIVVQYDSDKSQPDSSVRKVGGSRKNGVKPKKRDMKGKSRKIVKSEDDKSDVELKISKSTSRVAGDKQKPYAMNGDDDSNEDEFPSISELAASTIKDRNPAVTSVPKKIMIKGTKRKTDLDDISGDERDSDIQEVDVKASVNKSAKRAKTNLAVGKHVEIRKKGVGAEPKEYDEGEVKSDEGSDDEVCVPVVKGYGSDDENSREREEVKDEAMELPVVRSPDTYHARAT
ncbi:hypothetical protein GLOTRDRAFT_97358 [Gloeophyllum trabeum ATCC 11539]|uniref:Uncharacterized protein n=1 Tax=Gloeophyllum trabeum (strain ATCC 11539 / FP-39264 / Madison 617) TaxID=670483 RepID=S7PPL1_GLOTA|nr:uncharacterized protein GLOTRDRAFT_97358 [Gloeophyllum trabeum ATCC 11539]EPQ49806.1 hypothetical protein GLOTRDRAFT_97358 [Gloeophyllum trabeum ATCC 11539]